MRNRNRVLICAVMSISVVSSPPSTACVNDPPTACYQSFPVCWPLPAISAGDYAKACGGNSYDYDNGSPHGFDNGITWHDWSVSPTCGSASIVNYGGTTHGCVYLSFDCVGRHNLYQQVTDDDYPPAKSEWAECDVWIFSMDLDTPNNPAHRLGVGDTTDLSLAYAPSNLYAGYKKLSVNTGGVIEVLQGSTVVISGTDKVESWILRSEFDPSTLTVKGVSPGQATLLLQYSPNGSTIPSPTHNGDSVTVSVVGVYDIEIYVSQWSAVTGSTITVLKGAKYNFRATPNPTGAQWPAQRPVWTLNGNQIGAAGDTSVQVTFDSVGTQTLAAKCGTGDQGQTVTINVIVPQPDEISFVDNNADQEHDIDGVTDPVWKRVENPNNPACYTKNKKMKVNAKFWAPANLTYPTQVKVDGSGFSEDTTVTFQSWPSETTVHVADSNLADSIGTWNVTITWTYKVIPQPNQEVTMSATSGPHKIHTVWDAPKCASNLYTKTNLDTCVTEWASDCIKVDTSNDSNNVPHQVQHGAKNWYNTHGYQEYTGTKDDPFTWIPAHKGDCITYADLMTKALLLLGIDAETKEIQCKDGANRFYLYSNAQYPHWLSADGDSDGDGITNEHEAGYPGVLEDIYEYGGDPAHNESWRTANRPWNFHGACSCAGHWWEITFNTTPDHDTEANMSRHPNGPVIRQRGYLYPDGWN